MDLPVPAVNVTICYKTDLDLSIVDERVATVTNGKPHLMVFEEGGHTAFDFDDHRGSTEEAIKVAQDFVAKLELKLTLARIEANAYYLIDAEEQK